MAGDNHGSPHDQRKREDIWPPYDAGARIISYNLNEGERPGGVKIRFKIRVVTGKQAGAVDRQQADAIKEYLQWVRQYRQSRSSGHGDTASGRQEPRPPA